MGGGCIVTLRLAGFEAMPPLAAVLILTLTLQSGQVLRTMQNMESLSACLELAEAWLSQSGNAPALRHGGRLTASCSIDVPNTIDH